MFLFSINCLKKVFLASQMWYVLQDLTILLNCALLTLFPKNVKSSWTWHELLEGSIRIPSMFWQKQNYESCDCFGVYPQFRRYLLFQPQKFVKRNIYWTFVVMGYVRCVHKDGSFNWFQSQSLAIAWTLAFQYLDRWNVEQRRNNWIL